MKYLLSALLLCSCDYTLNVTVVHTQGQATDVVDDTTTDTSQAAFSIPISPL